MRLDRVTGIATESLMSCIQEYGVLCIQNKYKQIELLDDVAPRLLLGLEAAVAELGGILLDNLLPLVELGPVHCLDVVDKVVKVLVLGRCPRVQSRQRSRCPDRSGWRRLAAHCKSSRPHSPCYLNS